MPNSVFFVKVTHSKNPLEYIVNLSRNGGGPMSTTTWRNEGNFRRAITHLPLDRHDLADLHFKLETAGEYVIHNLGLTAEDSEALGWDSV
jgi:hypothetical protein